MSTERTPTRSQARRPAPPASVRVRDTVRTAAVAVWVVAATVAFGLRVIRLGACGGPALHATARAWARSILKASRVRVSVFGGDRVRPGRPYIIMANHQGNYDIPALLGHLPIDFRWVAKAELFRIPLFGRAMRAVGCIPIDRGDRESAYGSLERAAAVLKGGTSVLIFPEGTRSPDGRLLPFKKGGFALALSSGVPIVPVAVRGSTAIMPRGICRVRPGDITLTIGSPVPTAGLRHQDRDSLTETVRGALARALHG